MRKYIQEQEKQAQIEDQIRTKEYENLFKGRVKWLKQSESQRYLDAGITMPFWGLFEPCVSRMVLAGFIRQRTGGIAISFIEIGRAHV